jgi:hypothetical protein
MPGDANSVGTSSNKDSAWNEQDPMGSLAALYRATVQRGKEQINWYRKKVRPKRLGSQACRFAAILFFGLAALIPLIKAADIWHDQQDSQASAQRSIQFPFELGYIAAALAAGLIAFDRYFGLSTGWIRYIQTQLALEGSLDELQYDWVAFQARIQGANPASEQVQAMIQRLRSFIVFSNGQTQQETQAWVMEFQSNLADLEKAAKVRAQEQKPGTLEVTVSNALDFDPGLVASLDGMERRTLEGKSCVFANVTPGGHIIVVRGAKSGKDVQASEIIRVQPDAVASASLALPIP